MAMVIGMMFNIILPINFNSPYKSINIQEFWRKWHITLGRFMTNYLYIPLGGNRKGELKTLRNLFIVFLASGIWHGASWNFIIWGMLHGICILIHRIWKNTGKKLPKLIGWFITINLVNIFWVFFRAENLQSAVKILRGMVDIPNLIYMLTHLGKIKEMTLKFRTFVAANSNGTLYATVFLLFSMIIVFFLKNSFEKNKKLKFSFINSIETVIYFWFGVFSLIQMSEFLYFNF